MRRNTNKKRQVLSMLLGDGFRARWGAKGECQARGIGRQDGPESSTPPSIGNLLREEGGVIS